MSAPIQKTTSKKAAAALSEVDDSRDGSSLLAPLHLEDELEDTKIWMSSNRFVGQDEVPRFGLLSLKMQGTPCYVYGHPALKALSKTAFTDGIHIFICDEFYEKLRADVDLSKGRDFGIELLLLHELMHMMFNHVLRGKQFPPRIRNQATDLSINTKLQMGFPEMSWCATLRETGLGFKPGDLEKYPQLAEETIMRELINEEFKKEQKEKKEKPGSGKSGSGKSGDGAEGESGEDGPSEGFGEDGDNHLIDLRDLIETLEEAGLQNVIDNLNLPHSDDPDIDEKIGELREEVKLRDIDAVQKAAAQRRVVGERYPGGSFVDAAEDMVRGFVKGKLNWRLGLREVIFGEGMKSQYDEEEPDALFYVDEIKQISGVDLYIGQDLPFKPQDCVLVLLDTSGSISEKDLQEFLSEVFELKLASSGVGDAASEVILISADTVLRGDHIEINDDNVDALMAKGIKVFGRGGNDLTLTTNQAIALPIFQEKKIKSLVYFTDLYDTPPKRKDLKVEDDVNFVFICPGSTHSAKLAEFTKDVEDYARVYPIEEGMEADLNTSTRDGINPPTRKQKP